ncbi:MAG: chemotaxis protein CheX [bacterium]|nr:chemotaxis protein CheX [bacterium]
MSNHNRYSKLIVRSVNHIFSKFLDDDSIEEIYETQAGQHDPQVAVEIKGTIKGEIIINLPHTTLDHITKKFIGVSSSKNTIKNSHGDVAGELANLITGTFANQLQYVNHELVLSPPEFNDDPIEMKALFDNVNLSFSSSYGGFDIDLYFKDLEE